MRVLVLLVLASILFPANSYAQSCQQPIDVVFSMDSSGSIRQGEVGSSGEFDLWFQQIDAVEAMVNTHDISEDKTRIAILNTSSCRDNDIDRCLDPDAGAYYRMKVEHSMSGNSDSIKNRLADMDESDFNTGMSWWDETLRLALSQFENGSRDQARKVLVYMAEGGPVPSVRAPCSPNSPPSGILKTLQEYEIEVLVISMNAPTDGDINMQKCLTEDPANNFAFMTSMSDFYGKKVTNDNDDDDLCGDLDACPFDPLNDIDGDGLCGEVDPDMADTHPDYIAPDLDDDNDGVADVLDTCPTGNIGNGIGHPYGDADGDGCDDREDADADNDGLLNDDDAYPLISINGFADNDNDGIPDNCNNLNCLGMAEDDDDDNDLVKDENDAFPLDASESKDSDGDGIGDNQDQTPNGDGSQQGPDTDPDNGPDNTPEGNSKSSGGVMAIFWLLMAYWMLAVTRQRRL